MKAISITYSNYRRYPINIYEQISENMFFLGCYRQEWVYLEELDSQFEY